MDPRGVNFLRSTIESDRDSWSIIARHVASLLLSGCMSGDVKKMAALLMSIEFWIKDVALECHEAFQNQTDDTVLPPLVCCDFLENHALLTFR
jgi:hypothetical protein